MVNLNISPKHLTMWNNWSMSDSPANSGSPVNISDARQPIAQISTGLKFDK